MNPVASQQFIKALPKVELHVHLEGTATPEFWKKLLEKHNSLDPIPSLSELEKRYQFRTFLDFLEVFRDVLFSFRTPGDFYDLTVSFLNDLVKQNVRYCEVMLTPWFVAQRGIDYFELMAEIDRAAKEIEAEAEIEMKLILDGPRNFGPEVVKEVFDMAVADKTGRVIGVGLGGDEKNFPAEWFANEFEFARSHGLNVIAHAGETAGEASMLNAIEKLKVSRIGHCLAIPAKSKLENTIFENNITLDLCPWSNVATRVIDEIGDHPMFDYFSRGYPITLNSDDPGMFGTSITKEYQTMVDLYGLSRQQLAQISKNAVNGSFLENPKKQRLVGEIEGFCQSADQ